MLQTAVVGVGHYGAHHARKYSILPESKLAAVVDTDPARGLRIAEETGTVALTDYRELLGAVRAVSIAVPTRLHHEIARAFLEAGCHVLLEKPIATTLEEASELVAIARRNDAVLQVGHVERFNPVAAALSPEWRNAKYVEADRIAPFSTRNLDIDVVLDLMIHDIDLVQNLVDAPLQHVAASGAVALSNEIDVASAELRFENGSAAHLRASRVGAEAARELRLFRRDASLTVDFIRRSATTRHAPRASSAPPVIREQNYGEGDALEREIASFLHSATTGASPLVSGPVAARALATALRISKTIRAEAVRPQSGV